MGVLGALTNNGVGIAGMTWNPYILPVRALGKCGGYDSDIIAGIQWAAGMSVDAGVPDNPYPADIINLSLGGSGSCGIRLQTWSTTLTAHGRAGGGFRRQRERSAWMRPAIVPACWRWRDCAMWAPRSATAVSGQKWASALPPAIA